MLPGLSNNRVPSIIVPNCEIMFVGEAPGREEDRQGKPFVGPAGQLLRHACKLAGIDFDKCSIANAVPYRPHGNRTPTPEEITYFHSDLVNDIKSANPAKIIALGAVAATSLLQKKINVLDKCGTIEYVDYLDKFVCITIHPALLLREPEYLTLFTIQLAKFKDFKGVFPSNSIEFKIIKDIQQIEDLGKECAIDIETSGFSPIKDEILCIAISGNRNYVLTSNFEQLKDLIRSVETIYMYNAKFDIKFLLKYGIDPNALIGKVRDVMICTRLAFCSLDPVATPSLDLVSRTWSYAPKKEDLIKQYVPSKKKGSFRDVPIEILAEYCITDANLTLRIGKAMESVLPQTSTQLYATLNELTVLTAEYEVQGIRVDLNKLHEVEQALHQEEQKISSQIYQLAGYEFNINSTKQLREILFDRLQLKPVGKTPKGLPSTDSESLEELASYHPICNLLLKHREIEKLRSTFVDGLRKFMIVDRVYPTINLAGTITGRTSCHEPNLQQIPREPKQIRQLFLPEENSKWVEIDLERAELYMLAFYAKDDKLLEDLKAKDFHTDTAIRIGLASRPEDVDKETRMLAKQIVFGIAYGSSAKGLARLGIPEEKLEKMIESFFSNYKKVHNWMQKMMTKVYEGMNFTYFSGRVRSFMPFPEDLDMGILSRRAVNSPIQGTVADYVSCVTHRIIKRFKQTSLNKCRYLFFLHDAVHFSLHESQFDQALQIIKEEFNEGAFNLKIPYEVKVGNSWGSVEEHG